jgi:hypothetical protein
MKTINLIDLDVPSTKLYVIMTEFVDAAKWIKLIWVVKKTEGLDSKTVRQYSDAFCSIVSLYNKYHKTSLNYEDPLMNPELVLKNNDWDKFFPWFMKNTTQAKRVLAAD